MGAFDIKYMPRTVVKRQVLANLVELAIIYLVKIMMGEIYAHLFIKGVHTT